MQNLDQIRAAAALAAAESTSRQAVSKLPAMIMTNGLLSASAFADERGKADKPKREKMQAAMNAVARHLKNPVHGITVLESVKDIKTLATALSEKPATSLDLQRATHEGLAFLAYLKRYAVKDEDKD